MADGGVRVEPTVPPVPSDLLAPLLGVAADVLHDLEEAPEGMAADDGFGDELVLAPSDDTLRRVIEQDTSFRRSVSARFLEDPRALDALDGWSVDSALDRVREGATDLYDEALDVAEDNKGALAALIAAGVVAIGVVAIVDDGNSDSN